jgi:malonyl-CoA/methylmalonyl-CoA synthetase
VLEIRGPNVFSGYWCNAEKTTESFTTDGWFVTGDVAVIDAGGVVSIVGREKDLIISGGLNVYPREVEAEIDALPGVRESAVVGVPHPDFGEGVIAVVDRAASEPDEAAVVATLRARLAAFKVPKRVFFVDALPRNAMGKVQKNVLRAEFAEAFRR